MSLFRSKQNSIFKILKLAIPVSLGQVSHIIANISDHIMLGKYNTTEFAAASFASNVFFIPLILMIGMTIGLTSVISNYLGENNDEKIKLTFKNAWILYTVIGVVLLLISFIIMKLFPYMGQDPKILPYAYDYYSIILLGILPITWGLVLKQYIEGLGNSTLPMISSFVGNLLNIGLNYLFIFGNLGFPEMGIKGAAIATLISKIVIFLVLILTCVFYKPLKPYFIKSTAKTTLNDLKFLFKISLNIGFQMFLEVAAFVLSSVGVGWLGKEYLAAHQIVLGIISVTYVLTSGLGSAATMIIGKFNGSKDWDAIKEYGNKSIWLAIIFMTLSATCLLVFRKTIPLLYVNPEDKKIIEIASKLFILAAVFQISDGVQVVCLGILRGLQDLRIPTWITISAHWIITLPVAYILGFVLDFGVSGVWIAYIFSLTNAAILLFLRFKWIIKKKKGYFISSEM